MARRKSRLQLQQPKNPYRKNKKFSQLEHIPLNKQFKIQKRKNLKSPINTPTKSARTARKVPYKSPLYLASPANKKKRILPSSRALFTDKSNDGENDSFHYNEFQLLNTDDLQEHVTCTSSSVNTSLTNAEAAVDETVDGISARSEEFENPSFSSSKCKSFGKAPETKYCTDITPMPTESCAWCSLGDRTL